MATATSSVIDQQRHGSLLADLPRVAELAGIPPGMITAPMNEYCSSQEIAWLKGIRRHIKSTRPGFFYVGEHKPLVLDRMMAMGGALVRNYIDTKVMPLSQVMNDFRGPALEVQVLLVPGFHTDDTDALSKWQSTGLYGLLLSRIKSGHQATILQVGSQTRLAGTYGEAIANLISHHFKKYD